MALRHHCASSLTWYPREDRPHGADCSVTASMIEIDRTEGRQRIILRYFGNPSSFGRRASLFQLRIFATLGQSAATRVGPHRLRLEVAFDGYPPPRAIQSWYPADPRTSRFRREEKLLHMAGRPY